MRSESGLKRYGRGSWFFSGLTAGALLFYFFDPSSGRRRRILFRDRFVRSRNESIWYASKQLRNFNHHLQGWVARSGMAFRTREAPDDETLVQRVRSAMGRKVRHPGSIEVSARNGKVTLKGLVLANEIERLFDLVRNVRGVKTVVNALEVHRHSDNIPGLQG